MQSLLQNEPKDKKRRLSGKAITFILIAAIIMAVATTVFAIPSVSYTHLQTIEFRVDNTLIRGRVQLHKTEAVDEPSSVESDKENTFPVSYTHLDVYKRQRRRPLRMNSSRP